MSYIDTAAHECCGFLASVPLYHPLGVYTDPYEFQADSTQLVLGGGSGEHPGAVLEPTICVLAIVRSVFIQLMDAEDKDSDTEDPYMAEWFAKLGLTTATLDALEDTLQELSQELSCDYSDWGGINWYHFVKNAMNSSGWVPFKEEDRNIERWIEDSIGEYIVVCMPELILRLDEVKVHSKTLEGLKTILGRSPHMGNVVQLPTGYQVLGRGASISDPNMRH